MSKHPIQIAAMIAALRSAKTPSAERTATAAVSVTVLPPFTAVCEKLLRRTQLPTFKTGEELAVDTLHDALPALRRGACPSLNNAGLLRWLSTAAHRRLIDAYRTRCGTSYADIVDVLEAVHAGNRWWAVGGEYDEEVQAFPHAYADAVAALPAHLRAVWQLIVEQDVPVIEVAAELGVDRTTVWRRVNAARALLASQLASFAR